MNHVEQAENLLARYNDGQGSDQLAIAHALLAVNETLRDCFGERTSRTPDNKDQLVRLDTLLTSYELMGVPKEGPTSRLIADIRHAILSEEG